LLAGPGVSPWLAIRTGCPFVQVSGTMAAALTWLERLLSGVGCLSNQPNYIVYLFTLYVNPIWRNLLVYSFAGSGGRAASRIFRTTTDMALSYSFATARMDLLWSNVV
jgi:hypothetical protein